MGTDERGTMLQPAIVIAISGLMVKFVQPLFGTLAIPTATVTLATGINPQVVPTSPSPLLAPAATALLGPSFGLLQVHSYNIHC